MENKNAKKCNTNNNKWGKNIDKNKLNINYENNMGKNVVTNENK